MPAPRSFSTAFPPLLMLPAPLASSRPGLSANALPGVDSASLHATFTVDEIVAAYQQGGRQKAANGTRDVPPRPGDVLTYGPATTYGHTSVLESTNLDGSGKGAITAVEENDSAGGSSTLTVGWTVQAFEPVTGWLHRAWSEHTLH